MRTLLWLLALFALAVGVSLAFDLNEGYVLVVWPPWRLELTLNLLFVLLLTGFVLTHYLLRLAAAVLGLPAAVRALRQRRRHEKAWRSLREAVLQLFAGRYAQAIQQADKAYAAAETPALAALVAARAAHGLQDAQREQTWLARAAEHDGEAHEARLMTEIELNLEAGRHEEALALLETLQKDSGRHVAALRLGLRAQRALGRWEDVLKLTRQLEKHHALSAAAAAPLKLRAHLENLHRREGDAGQLASYWETIAGAERQQPRLATGAARALLAAGDSATAQRIIERQLDQAWDSDLAELYGECHATDALSRIARAERWLVEQPHDARLLLTLGRLCRAQQLWGKAQSYFEASLAIEPSQSGHLELASLFEELGREAESNRAYREAAALCCRGSAGN